MPVSPDKKRATPEAQFDKKVFSTLEKIAEIRTRKNQLRLDHKKLFEEMDELVSVESTLVEAVKSFVVTAAKSLGKGTHTIVRFGGVEVVAKMTREVDTQALIADHPKLLKLAKVRYSISVEEVDRLIAADVLTPVEASGYVSFKPRLSVATERVLEEVDDAD